MNFISTFDELNKLYEAAEETTEEVSVEEVSVDEEVIEDEDTVEIVDDETRQLALQCSKCGAIMLKDEADVTIDEETDLANADEECQYCEEAAGYAIVGVVSPYLTDGEQEPIEEGLFDSKYEKEIREKMDKRPITTISSAINSCVKSIFTDHFYSETGELPTAIKSPVEGAAKHGKPIELLKTIIELYRKYVDDPGQNFGDIVELEDILDNFNKACLSSGAEKYLMKRINKGIMEAIKAAKPTPDEYGLEEGIFDKLKSKKRKEAEAAQEQEKAARAEAEERKAAEEAERKKMLNTYVVIKGNPDGTWEYASSETFDNPHDAAVARNKLNMSPETKAMAPDKRPVYQDVNLVLAKSKTGKAL